MRAHPAIQAFSVAFALALAVGLIQGEKPFFYDAGAYWALSESFVSNGHFSLLNFGNPTRGYALPMVYFLVRNAGETLGGKPWLTAVVFNAALFSLIGAVLLPRLAVLAWPRLQWSFPRRIALFCLLLAFWRGYISYPLSDFPALTVGLLAIVAVSSPTSVSWMATGGASAALAFEFRPAYIAFVPILLVLILWSWHRDESLPNWRRRVLCLSVFLLAGACVVVPQSLVEHHRIGSYSPVPGGNRLASLQYTEGLRLQRYETFVGGEPDQAPMYYRDPHTRSLLASLDGREVTSTGQYAEVVLNHPLTMLGVFLRHIVNGLDQRYSTPYVEHIQTSTNRIWRLAGFLIVFLAMLRIAWPRMRRALAPAHWRYPLALLLVSATSIASAVETRFLLPVFVLCLTVVLTPNWVNPLGRGRGFKRYRSLAIAVAAGFAFLVFAAWITQGASDNLHLGAGG